MKRAFLLAHPAGHSISPALHNAAFGALGIAAHYQALDVAPEALGATLENLRAPDVLGANVTIPHKVAVMSSMDSLTPAAKTIGAVNTIINHGGKLTGDNTDASGFLRALLEDADFQPRGKRALVLGAGGAGRAVVYALLSAGVGRLELYNRSPEKVTELQRDFAHLGMLEAVGWDDMDESVRGADLLVNTTSVGMSAPDVSPLPPGLLPYKGFVCDIIYRPPITRLLHDAQALKLPTQNGLPMLIYQGAEAFTRWTGQEAPVGVMLEAALAALAPA